MPDISHEIMIAMWTRRHLKNFKVVDTSIYISIVTEQIEACTLQWKLIPNSKILSWQKTRFCRKRSALAGTSSVSPSVPFKTNIGTDSNVCFSSRTVCMVLFFILFKERGLQHIHAAFYVLNMWFGFFVKMNYFAKNRKHLNGRGSDCTVQLIVVFGKAMCCILEELLPN